MKTTGQHSTKPSAQLSRYAEHVREREAREHALRSSRRKAAIVHYAVGAVLFVIIFGGMGWGVWRGAKKEALVLDHIRAEERPDLGREHVTSVDITAYDTLPPTSGPHYAQQTNWGIHAEPVPEGYQVHNLEHGGVLMQYKPDAPQDIVERLKKIGDDYQWKKIILAPYSANEKRITLTAWRRIDALDDIDESRIRAFIDAYRNKGPEDVPDDMPSFELP